MKTTPPRKPNVPPRPGRTRRGLPGWLAVLGYGFRPFFLLAGLHASLAVPLWIANLHGSGPLQTALPALAWHAHEMLFGFVAAAAAGFLLTAVPSWTGHRGYAGAPLAGLVLLWLAGRLAMSWPSGLPPPWAALVDLAFLPALALMLLPALIRSGNRRNLAFIVLLALLFTSNLQFHFGAQTASEALRLGINVMLLMVSLIGRRVLPAFTAAGLRGLGRDAQIGRHPLLDRAALLAVAGVLIIDLLAPGGATAALTAAVAALLLAAQLLRWQGHRCLDIPLLWILHAAYAWLPVSLALKAATLAGLPIAANAWLHALTAGAMATMIIGIMSRAALGHTGRPLIAPAAMRVAYLSLTTAALTRVFGPLLYASAELAWLALSAALWSLAFGLFVIVYAPILCRPRVDGRPG